MLLDIWPGEGIKPNDNLYYGVSIQSSLPRLHLVSRSQIAAKVVWPRETSLHHSSAYCSKIDKTIFTYLTSTSRSCRDA